MVSTQTFSFSQVQKRVAHVSGSTTGMESKLLYHLARKAEANGVVVEIGSFLGKSTIFLASGSKEAKQQKVYAIDPHAGAPVINKKFSGPTYQRFLRNIEGASVRDAVVPIKKTSDEAFRDWHRPIRLLFVDGDHAYQAVKRDLKQWGSFVVEKGVIALHDALNPGVGPPRAIVEVLLSQKDFSRFGVVDSIFYGTKMRPKTLFDWINWYFFAGAMRLTAALISFTSGSRPRKIKTAVQQKLVKTWLKRWLTGVTLAVARPF